MPGCAIKLQTALSSRVIIEQAKGVLAERGGTTPEEAFTLLRRHARGHHQTMSDLARAVVESSTARDAVAHPGEPSPRRDPGRG